MTATKSIPETSAETHAIAAKIRELKPGDVLSYAQINGLFGAGFNVQGKNRHNLESAKTILLNEDSMVIACVHGIGVKRMTESDKVTIGGHAIQKTRRIAKRAVKKMATTDSASLSQPERVALLTSQSVLGAVLCCTKPSLVKQVEFRVTQTPQRIPFGEFAKV